MNEKQFWQHIEESANSDDFFESLKTKLCSQGLAEITSFENHLLSKLVEAYKFPLLSANFVISSYVSDEGFKDFRAWLISQGETKFNDALNNPESIVNWLSKEDIELIDGEELIIAAEESYLELGGDEEDFFNSLNYPKEPDIEMNWPENKEEFEKFYPLLVRKFWDQEKIEEMHS